MVRLFGASSSFPPGVLSALILHSLRSLGPPDPDGRLFLFVDGHGTMLAPVPRQPEPLYWYNVGCMTGCTCSGSGKEPYPSLDSVDCRTPVVPTNDQDPATLTFNAHGLSPHDRTTTTAWNRYFPWRAPGTSRPIDSCGIASGFVPEAAVQYPHTFTSTTTAAVEEEGSPPRRIPQGYHGSALPPGPRTYWEVGAVVEVSFSLVVNHGGGYQYRVCRQKQPEENATATAKDGAAINEACFEQNPLEFVDEYHIVTTTTTTHESTDNNSNSQKEEETKITIPATDVTGENVYPVGSTWRRIPIPACNCDSGGPCLPHTTLNTTTDREFNVAYTQTAEPYGTCPTGLQFYPEHITQGLWPEGYGYYVATLRRTRQNKSTEDTATTTTGMKTTASFCSNHFDAIVCSADTTSECHWSIDKQMCYSGGNSKQQQQQSSDIKIVAAAAAGAAGSTSTSNSCYDYTNEDSCIGGMENGNQRCLWYESPSKTVCYNPTATATAKQSNADGTSTKEDADDHKYENKNNKDGQVSADWYITDRVYAPSETGAYILQWRWDNEQTPQIWTTCADIEVVADATAAAAAVAAATGTNDGQQQQQQQNDGSGHDNVDSSSRSDSTTNSLEHKIFPFLVAMMMAVGGVALL